MRIPLSIVLVVTACTSLPAVPTPGPSLPGAPPPQARAITPTGYNNETSLAIDPAHPARVVAAWQVPATVGWSADSGLTWRWQALPGVERWQLSGDPIVAFDGDGRAYALYIAFDRPDDYDTLGKAAHRNGILINESSDGGRTWRAAPTAVILQPGSAGVPFEDKPAIGIDRTADPRRRGTIYVAWTEFRRHESVIMFARSSDSGTRFSPAIEISDRAGSPKDSVGADEGTTIAVASDGTVYVAWSDSVGIHVDRSVDAGHTFGADVLVARTPDIVFGVPGVARVNGYPAIGVDPGGGGLYIMWVDPRSGRPEPYVASSTDGGQNWSPPRLVAPPDDNARFFAWMAVDQRTSLVAISYYKVVRGRDIQYMLATSTDLGRTFREMPWGRPFDPADQFLGDYTGVDAHGGLVAAAWTEIARPAFAPGAAGMEGRHDARVVIGRWRVPNVTPSAR